MIFAIVFDRYGCFVREYENIAGAEHYHWSLQITYRSYSKWFHFKVSFDEKLFFFVIHLRVKPSKMVNFKNFSIYYVS